MPTGRQVPEGGKQPINVPSTTTGSGYTTDTQFEPQGTANFRMLVGHWMVGGGGVRTVILKLHSARPHGFVATQVTTVVPMGKQVSRAGLQLSSAPLKTGGPVTVAGSWKQLEQVVNTRSFGQSMRGGRPWPCTTVMGNSQPTDM